MVDWNNDGKKDLLTGEFEGTVRIFINVGTDAAPSFLGHVFLQMGGSDFDCGKISMPTVVDWNNDGKKDLLCGEDFGYVILLINIGTDAAPVFTTFSAIQSGGLPLNVGDRSSPTVADWNNDGKKDLLVGNYDGQVLFFPNVGTDAAPAFAGHAVLEAGGSTLDVDHYARPQVLDWDGDGIDDLIVGNCDFVDTPTGGVYLFRGKGPLFADLNSISVSAGGSVTLALDAGAAHAGRYYLILGSLSGSSPGIPLPNGGVTLPVNWDGFTDQVLARLNGGVFGNFFGLLNAAGKATATFTVPMANPNKTWEIMTYAYCLEGQPDWDYASNPVPIQFWP